MVFKETGALYIDRNPCDMHLGNKKNTPTIIFNFIRLSIVTCTTSINKINRDFTFLIFPRMVSKFSRKLCYMYAKLCENYTGDSSRKKSITNMHAFLGLFIANSYTARTGLHHHVVGWALHFLMRFLSLNLFKLIAKMSLTVIWFPEGKTCTCEEKLP